jgi:hypothetical protein
MTIFICRGTFAAAGRGGEETREGGGEKEMKNRSL